MAEAEEKAMLEDLQAESEGMIETPEMLIRREAFDRGLKSGASLSLLQGVIMDIYYPLLASSSEPLTSATKESTTSLSTATGKVKMNSAQRAEFLSKLQQFAMQMAHAIQRVNGEMQIRIPRISLPADGDDRDVPDDVISEIENAVEEWTPIIVSHMEKEAKKLPTGDSPLAEVEFWRERHASLSTIYEKLNSREVQAMLRALQKAESPVLGSFTHQFNELVKQYSLAKDNVKFLATLERHFKNISMGSLATIQDSIPSLMNALRIVWTISRHYSKDENIVPLMMRIAWEIANKVSTVINIKTIFREPYDSMKQKLQEARAALMKWRETYYSVRQKMEAQYSEKKWDFDTRKLFDQTDYMADRCGDLFEIAKVLEEFNNILGHELKAVTGDAHRIDDVLRRLQTVVSEIENISFPLFDKRYQTSWETVMAKFTQSVEEIEAMARQFIDASFGNLRSAEGAFDLLQNFKNIQKQSRDTINRQMLDKFSDILEQYSKEIDRVRELFEQNRREPPVFKNQPPVAGAIAWCRSLFHRIKKPILRFQSLPEMIDSEKGRAVSKKYLAVGRIMREYETKRFQTWAESVDSIATAKLRQCILVQEPSESALAGVTSAPSAATVNGVATANGPTALSTGRIKVNFDHELVAIVRETKCLDRLGFKVPEVALNLTLQEDKYHQYVDELNRMLRNYYQSIDSLPEAEREILAAQRAELAEVLKPGIVSLNWNSLGIPDFIKRCNQEIAKFQGIVNQIQHFVATLNGVLENICKANLIPETALLRRGGDVLDLQEFFEDLEKHRKVTVDELARQYATIGPHLGRVEGIVAKTSTCRSPLMRSYYAFWERRVFNSLNFMVLRNIANFQSLMHLKSESTAATNALIDGAVATAFPPLFRITASLSAPEVVTSPSFADVSKVINKILTSIVESTRHFVRWKKGTCIETPPQAAAENEEPVVFSFFTDISANPQVLNSMLTLKQGIRRTFAAVSGYLDKWRRYKPLWRVDKVSALEKYFQGNPTCAAYDDKLALYTRRAAEVRALPTERDFDFIRLSCAPLAASIESEATTWVFLIGKMLNESARPRLLELNETFNKIRDDLHRTPDTMDDLKFILNVIDQIRTSSMDVEFRYAEIEERYRTLRKYGLSVSEDELRLVDGLRGRWVELQRLAKQIDGSLDQVKAQFTETTKRQVSLFKRKVQKLSKKFFKSGPGSNSVTKMEAGLELVKKYQKELSNYKKLRDELVLAEKLFNLPITSYPELVNIENELKGLAMIYSLYVDMKDTRTKWGNTLWSELDIDMLVNGIEDFAQRLKRLPANLHEYYPYGVVQKQILSFKEGIPLFQHLKNPALRPRHWKTLMEATGISFAVNKNSFTLESVFAMELHKYADVIADITAGAMKELSIEQGIAAIADTWKTKRFQIQKYVRGTEDKGYILKGVDDITMQLDEHSMQLQTMSSSRFVTPFADQVQQWEKTLSVIAEVVDVWMMVQRKWMYLESIFMGSADIRTRLPDEARRFDLINRTFKRIMMETAKNTLVLHQCRSEDLLELLKSLAQKLELCQKSLSEYLETKRNVFARFFFISDDELLSVLGSQDPRSIQEFMIKLFDNVLELNFGSGQRNNKYITGMTSSEGEVLEFKQIVMAEGTVETWMLNVEAEMRRTLRAISKEALYHYAKMKRTEWIYAFPGMVSLLGSQIWWTWQVEDAFRTVRDGDKFAMKNLSSKLHSQIADLVAQVRRSDLTDNDRRKVNTLLIIDVHARDVIDVFVRDSVLDDREFAWESQLRYYWDRNNDDVMIKQCSGVFAYGYEYLGLCGRLVITPLTDRCIMTLTQALSMRLGGSPAGPAGTGKTETVKDLAKAMALPCVVFNCAEGLDYDTMGKILMGLVQCGGWGCFDEFNRIDPEVLSVISVLVSNIQNSMHLGLKRFQLMGKEISLDMKCGIFVTMNPGYAGRRELPDNLKALFRPVVMVVPDLELICEIMLFSEGFDQARALAKKLTVLYKLAEEQLSKQNHYDFGLRALKSVLVTAGKIKRAQAQSGQFTSEELVIIRALNETNVPKFVFEDVPLFLGLINDLFPNVRAMPLPNKTFYDAIEQVMVAENYQVIPSQIEKVIQLHETMQARHTTMVVGPTGGGKSVIIDMLAKANTLLGVPTKLYILNPKALTVNELFGTMDYNTRDWSDGLLSSLFREINKKPSAKKEYKFIVFDGDVDTNWVENMNSLMDDNKVLTLLNGDRLRLQDHCKLLFEVSGLQYASPATVSRCGMVYLDPRNLGYRPFFHKWLTTRRSKQEADVLRSRFEKYVPALLTFIFDGIFEEEVSKPLPLVVPLTPLNMVSQLCRLLTGMLTKEVLDARVLECFFIFALVWSLGAALAEEARPAFDKVLKRLSDWAIIENPEVTPMAGQLPQFPQHPTLFDFCFDTNDFLWTPWERLVEAFEPPTDRKFYKTLVPTVDTVRYTWLLNCCVNARQPVLFVGESGTAKTVTIQNYLRPLSTEHYVVLSVNFSSRTTSADLQRTLEYNVDRWSKGVYGPSDMNKHLIVFLDDLNMPRVDQYGTQQPIALLKLLIERGGMYDRGKEHTWKQIRNVLFIGAMGTPGGGRNSVDPRFVSLFNVFNITFPSEDSLRRIYASILTHHVEQFPEGFRELAGKITDVTLSLYRWVVATLPATPSKFHYVFNLRDLSRIYEGLCLSTPEKYSGSLRALLRLWRNECMRVFHDRLITQTDREMVRGKINQLLTEQFGEEGQAAIEDPLLFGDFRSAGTGDENASIRAYEDLKDYDSIRPIFEDLLLSYNEKHSPMNLVLFEDALEHLTRISRIITRCRGHALLVGIGGSGKQSLTRLAAYAAGYDMFQIVISKGYNEEAFREDLKTLYHRLGIENKETVFLFTEAQIVDMSFLELLNNMLTTGTVPALYSDDEKEQIIGAIRDDVIAARIFDSKENCWDFFLTRCRDNLHIVLSMTPGEPLRQYCRSFPGLVNCTTIDWFANWPPQALYSVANVFLAEEQLPEEHRGDIVNHMVHVHSSMEKFCARFEQQLRRKAFVTPKNFLDYIHNYTKLLAEHRERMNEQARRLEGGITKLQESAAHLDQLREKLDKQKAVVDEKNRDCNQLLAVIAQSKAAAEAKEEQATSTEKALNIRQEEIIAEKSEAEAALEAALPVLEEAKKALASLSRAELTEIRSFAKPPKAVQQVCECVCILKGMKERGWKPAKQMMQGTNFLNELLEINPNEISEKQFKTVKEVLKKLDMSIEKMREVSVAGAGMLNWLQATVHYCNVARKVGPKRKAVEKALKDLAKNQKNLEKTKEEVAALRAELAELSQKYAQGTAEQLELQEQAELMEKRLLAANQLISGLSTERVRWTKDLEAIEFRRARLVGDCLLAAAFLSYCGPFTYDFRRDMVYEDWQADLIGKHIPLTMPFRLEQLLATDVEIAQWAADGLPGDELSIQNGIVTTRSNRWPLCIDPQMQAVRWIKNREAKHKLIVLTFADPEFQRQLEAAVQFGVPVLIEGVDSYIDPIMNNLLAKKVITVGGSRKVIMLGNREVDWNDTFRLYMTTKKSNPDYAADIFGKVIVINYGVTQQGLQEQLLNIVVGYEKPQLEKKREKLIKEMAANRKLLKSFEDSLLQELATSQGLMLDNEELIATLEETKKKAVEIAEKLDLADVTAKELERHREEYLPAARRGATLFFVLASLSSVEPMYEHSLDAFISLYSTALRESQPDTSLEVRLRNIIDTLTVNVYHYTCMGLFEKHKLMFAFQLCLKILQGEDQLHPAELDFFLRGNTALEKSAKSNPCATWLPEQGWEDLQKLVAIGGPFGKLIDHLEHNEPAWRRWYDAAAPENEPLPLSSAVSEHGEIVPGEGERMYTLSAFQKMCVLRCFRVDRVYLAIQKFVARHMGEAFVKPPVVRIDDVYEYSSPTTPVVFILSPGANPVRDVTEFAEAKGFGGNRLKALALGQNQGPIAAQLIENAVTRGFWVMLQNCHLLTSWLKTLEKIIEKIVERGEKPSPQFRLWLTTEPTPAFPVGVLQRSVKVVTEPPNGLKQNMAASYAKIPESLLAECPHRAFRPLVYVLAFFHAVVQERRKYGKIGWNIPYDFNESDFRVSLDLLNTYLTKAHAVATGNSDAADALPWDSLRYLVGEVMYGGRVTDAFDRRVLMTYLHEYMGDFLFDTFQPFHFYKNDAIEYTVPPDGPLTNYVAAIERLPDDNRPDVLGLHPNAEIGYYTQATRELWRNLLDLAPRGGDALGGTRRENFVLAIANDIELKIPQLFDIPAIRKLVVERNVAQLTAANPQPHRAGSAHMASASSAAVAAANAAAADVLTPTQIVLFQELERFNLLVSKISSTLKDLRRALMGEIGMSSDLEEIGTSLFNGAIPAAWKRLAPATQKPLGSWIEHFRRRYKQYKRWAHEGEPPVMWLSGLHVPEAYLTALVQMACRKKGWPLDRAALFTTVTKYTKPEDVTAPPELGCYVTGLYMEGASWDYEHSCLRQQLPKQLVVDMPIMHIIPVETHRMKLQNTLRTPVYVTQERKNAMGVGLVFEAFLPTDQHPSHWVLQGVCLVLNTSS